MRTTLIPRNQVLNGRVVDWKTTRQNMGQQIQLQKLAVAPATNVAVAAVQNPEDRSLFLAGDEAHTSSFNLFRASRS